MEITKYIEMVKGNERNEINIEQNKIIKEYRKITFIFIAVITFLAIGLFNTTEFINLKEHLLLTEASNSSVFAPYEGLTKGSYFLLKEQMSSYRMYLVGTFVSLLLYFTNIFTRKHMKTLEIFEIEDLNKIIISVALVACFLSYLFSFLEDLTTPSGLFFFVICICLVSLDYFYVTKDYFSQSKFHLLRKFESKFSRENINKKELEILETPELMLETLNFYKSPNISNKDSIIIENLFKELDNKKEEIEKLMKKKNRKIEQFTDSIDKNYNISASEISSFERLEDLKVHQIETS